MTVTINFFWLLAGALLFAPILYSLQRKGGGDYDFPIDALLWFAICWPMLIGLIVGKYVF